MDATNAYRYYPGISTIRELAGGRPIYLLEPVLGLFMLVQNLRRLNPDTGEWDFVTASWVPGSEPP